MRRDGEGLVEKYIAIGKAIGEERGAIRGEKLGVAMGIISTARDLGAEDAYIVEKLMSFLDISEKQARNYIAAHEAPAGPIRSTKLRSIDGGRI